MLRHGRVLLFTVILICLLWTVLVSAASSFPQRPLEIVVPYAAGGATDTYVRVLAGQLEKILSTRIRIVNISGGEGVPAVRYFEKAPADGHTLFALGPEEVLNSIYGRIDFGVFQPVARVQLDQGMLWVRADSPFRTFQDLIADAKARPGKQIWTGSYGIDQVILGELFSKAGIKVTYVPYNVGREATAALLGGHAEVEFEEPGAMLSQIEAQSVRALVVLTENRISRFPDVPTGKELGVNVTTARWRGIATRAGTPQSVVAVLEEAIRIAAETDEYRNYAAMNVLDQNPGFMGAAAFTEYLMRMRESYRATLMELGIIE